MTDQPTRINEVLDKKSEKLENKPVETFYCEHCKKEVGHPTEEHGKNGGVRANSGRPKGSMNKTTRTALEAKNRFIQRVHRHVDDLFDAQLDLAMGEKILMVKITERDDDGKVKKVYHEVVSDPETIRQYFDNEEGFHADYQDLNSDEEYFYVTVKPANNQAIQGMMDRAFGKAPEKIEIEGGFFQADNLTINVIQPRLDAEKEIEKINESDSEGQQVIDVEPESEASPSDRAS